MADTEPAGRKSRRRKANLSGWFRQVFTAEPGLLYTKSNEELINRWKEAHPKHGPKDIPRARQSLANLKSQMRKQREAQGLAPAALGVATGAQSELDELADQIDECMARARQIDREELGEVIHWLRRARNEIILRNG